DTGKTGRDQRRCGDLERGLEGAARKLGTVTAGAAGQGVEGVRAQRQVAGQVEGARAVATGVGGDAERHGAGVPVLAGDLEGDLLASGAVLHQEPGQVDRDGRARLVHGCGDVE